MMKTRIVMTAALAAALAGAGARAQEGSSFDAAAEAAAAMTEAKAKQKVYHILPYCKTLEGGAAEVRRPGSEEWEPIVEGKFYALGTEFRTVGAVGKFVISLGKDVSVVVTGEGSFSMLPQPLGTRSRTVVLRGGEIVVSAPRTFPDGLLFVSAPGFMTSNNKGDVRYTYSPAPDGDGDVAVVRCLNGEATLSGSNFVIKAMRPAGEIKIRTSHDLLFTGLYGINGDNDVELDQGRVVVKDMTTGEGHEEEKTLLWKLSPKSVVRIHRAVPAVGKRRAVSVMTFDKDGDLRNRCVFAEHAVEVNSGEIGPVSQKEREELERRAAEATAAANDTVTVDIPADDQPAGGVSRPAPAQSPDAGDGFDDMMGLD